MRCIEALHKAQSERTVSWTIAAFPNEGWASQVFGEPDIERLWDAIAESVSLDEADPVDAWRAHDATLRERCRAARRARTRPGAFSVGPEPTWPSDC